MGSPDWHVTIEDIHFGELPRMSCCGDTGIEGSGRAERLACNAAITSGLHLERPEVLRSLRHYLRAQSQGHQASANLEETGHRKGKRSVVFLQRTRKDKHQSDQRWKYFTGNSGKASERRDGMYVAYNLWVFPNAPLPS